jgi:hypothetical protein
VPKEKMARVQHTEEPQSARQRGQVLLVLVEIRPSVVCVEVNQ